MFSFSNDVISTDLFVNGYSHALLGIEETESKTLNLDRLDLEFLPPEIGNKLDLHRVDLSHNKFTFLPPEIGKLTSIKELKLCSNMRVPFSLPPEIGNLQNLVNLKLSGNSLTSIPEELGNLSGVKIIDLSHNCLKTLPDTFSKLEQLVELRLDDNKLEKLPTFNSTLACLSLSCNNSFTSFNTTLEQIGELIHLKQLEMRSCEITQWPEIIGTLTNLYHLDIGCNRISSIPERALLSFPTIEKLYLDHNQLTEIPNIIGQLKDLKVLILEGNDFQELPLSFKNLKNLSEFTIDEENMLIPPREIIRKGLHEIKLFIDSLVAESLPCYRIRLMVLGDENSGKTSLIRSLRPSKSIKKSQNNIKDKDQYIDRKIFNITTKNNQSQDGSNVSIEFNTWDFCKNDYFISHQFFIQSKSIFIITFDLLKVQKERVLFWLQSISTKAGNNTPIFLVGTHSDDKLFKEENVLSTALNSIAQEFSSKFEGIKLITAVSSTDGSGIDELRNSLVSEVLKLKHVGKIIPKPYTLLEDAIKSLAQEKQSLQQCPIISWDTYTQLGAKCHIHTDSTLHTATSFLSDIGIVTTFADDSSASHLTPAIVLDPEWICKLTVSKFIIIFILI